MSTFSAEEKKFLQETAKETIIKKTKKIWLSEEKIINLPRALLEERGCFVTLHKNGNLRGCIGYILPITPLYKAVIENAYNAAYSDPRFPPVDPEELDDLDIEISVLTPPTRLSYNDKDDLLEKLSPGKDGVILRKGPFTSTFLPQVWEQLPDKEDFLNHLCLKAGLKHDEWKNSLLEVEIYRVEYF